MIRAIFWSFVSSVVFGTLLWFAANLIGWDWEYWGTCRKVFLASLVIRFLFWLGGAMSEVEGNITGRRR